MNSQKRSKTQNDNKNINNRKKHKNCTHLLQSGAASDGAVLHQRCVAVRQPGHNVVQSCSVELLTSNDFR